MGKSASSQAQRIEADAANRFAALSEKFEQEGAPARKYVQDTNTALAGGDPTKLQEFNAPSISAIRGQFSNARTQIERELPRGGVLDQAKANLSTAEASNIGNLFTAGREAALGRLQGISQFATSAGLGANSGAVSAGNSLVQLASGQKSALGQGLGGLFSGAGAAVGGIKSSEVFKTDFGPGMKPAEALTKVLSASIESWRFQPWIDASGKRRNGFVLERVDPIFREPDGKTIDIQSTIGVLMGAIQAQQAQIEAQAEQIKDLSSRLGGK